MGRPLTIKHLTEMLRRVGALRLVHSREQSQTVRVLDSTGLADATENTVTKLRAMHPPTEEAFVISNTEVKENAMTLSKVSFLQALYKPPRG